MKSASMRDDWKTENISFNKFQVILSVTLNILKFEFGYFIYKHNV